MNNLDFLNDLLHDEDFSTAVLCPHFTRGLNSLLFQVQNISAGYVNSNLHDLHHLFVTLIVL